MQLPVSVAILLCLTACRPEVAALDAGQLVASWEGLDRGSGRLDARAVYCGRDSTLEIVAHQGDRGIGVAIHLATRAIAPGAFPVVHPETEAVPRPGATGAYRFLTIEALHAFVSRSGEVELTAVGPDGISGRLTLHLTALAGPDTVIVRGDFLRLVIDSTRSPCGLAPRITAEIP